MGRPISSSERLTTEDEVFLSPFSSYSSLVKVVPVLEGLEELTSCFYATLSSVFLMAVVKGKPINALTWSD